MKTEFFTREELIQTWRDATLAKKEADDQIEVCKKALVEMDVPLNEEIVDGLYVTSQSRRSFSVPLELAKSVVGENWIDYVVVDKKHFEDTLTQKVKDGEMTELDMATVKDKYNVDSTSVSYILKSKK